MEAVVSLKFKLLTILCSSSEAKFNFNDFLPLCYITNSFWIRVSTFSLSFELTSFRYLCVFFSIKHNEICVHLKIISQLTSTLKKFTRLSYLAFEYFFMSYYANSYSIQLFLLDLIIKNLVKKLNYSRYNLFSFYINSCMFYSNVPRFQVIMKLFHSYVHVIIMHVIEIAIRIIDNGWIFFNELLLTVKWRKINKCKEYLHFSSIQFTHLATSPPDYPSDSASCGRHFRDYFATEKETNLLHIALSWRHRKSVDHQLEDWVQVMS